MSGRWISAGLLLLDAGGACRIGRLIGYPPDWTFCALLVRTGKLGLAVAGVAVPELEPLEFEMGMVPTVGVRSGMPVLGVSSPRNSALVDGLSGGTR